MTPCVLVVEDSPTQLEALRALLVADGIDVIAARDGEEALERTRREGPDLVLTDVVMPGMSGLDLCRAIKSELGEAAPAVVLITGLNDPRDIVRGLSSGADNYITKPYEPENVLSRVRGVLANRDVRRAARTQDGLRVRFMGEDFVLEAEPERMLEMLLGSFEELARTNRALRASQQALADASAREIEREQAMRADAERTADEMARLAREAEAATRARDEMLAAVSHDLRNPVATIYTSSALLLEMDLSPELRERQLNVIRRTSERMDRLIQDLLDVSKMEAGRFVVSPEPVAAADILRDAIEMLGPLADAQDLRLVERNEAGDALVSAEEEPVQRVLSNLVGNAIKFTPAGRTIEIGARRAGDMVEFSVRDEGAGIPPANLDHVFDRYWQAEGTARQGAGLGLAIARGIVEAHGGSIRAESEPPDGSTFIFTLPLANG